MEMIDRYIYAVTQRLPQSQREDIAEELRSLFEDMMEERVQSREVTDKDVEEVLLELGDPKQLAQKYRGTKNYVIGPELFEPYMSVLKIVVFSIIVSMSVIFTIQIILDPIAILDHFVSYIVSLVTVIPQGIGWLTLGFVLFEHFGGENAQDLNINKTWKPADLSSVPDPKRQIKRREPITGIVFYVLLIVMFAFSSHFLGVYVFKEGEFSTVIPFLNEEIMSKYLPFIILILGLSIFKETLKLISGKWTLKLVLYTVLINVVSLFVIWVMLTGTAFWNPDFMTELTQEGVVEKGSKGYGTIREIWNTSTLSILIIVTVGLIWDAAYGLIKVWQAK